MNKVEIIKDEKEGFRLKVDTKYDPRTSRPMSEVINKNKARLAERHNILTQSINARKKGEEATARLVNSVFMDLEYGHVEVSTSPFLRALEKTVLELPEEEYEKFMNQLQTNLSQDSSDQDNVNQ